MKGILLYCSVLLITLVLESSCTVPVPAPAKSQNNGRTLNISQTKPTCCSNKPDRFASGTPTVKLKK